MTVLVRRGDIPRRVDCIKTLRGNLGRRMGLREAHSILNALCDGERVETEHQFSPPEVRELRANGVEVEAGND